MFSRPTAAVGADGAPLVAERASAARAARTQSSHAGPPGSPVSLARAGYQLLFGQPRLAGRSLQVWLVTPRLLRSVVNVSPVVEVTVML